MSDKLKNITNLEGKIRLILPDLSKVEFDNSNEALGFFDQNYPDYYLEYTSPYDKSYLYNGDLNEVIVTPSPLHNDIVSGYYNGRYFTPTPQNENWFFNVRKADDNISENYGNKQWGKVGAMHLGAGLGIVGGGYALPWIINTGMPLFAKYIAAPTAASMIWNETEKAVTGTTGQKIVSDYLSSSGLNPYVSEFLGASVNPGNWINFGGAGKYTKPFFNKIGLGFEKIPEFKIPTYSEVHEAFTNLSKDSRNTKVYDPNIDYPEDSRTMLEHFSEDLKRGIFNSKDSKSGKMFFLDLEKTFPDLVSEIKMDNQPFGINHNTSGFNFNGNFEIFPKVMKYWYNMTTPAYGRGYLNKNGDIYKYYENIIKPLGKNYENPNVKLDWEVPIYFGPIKDIKAGFYSPQLNMAGLNTAERLNKVDWKSITLHEIISHFTDDLYKDALKGYGKITNALRDLGQHLTKIPKGMSFKPQEFRATTNLVRAGLNVKDLLELRKIVDNLSDEEIVNLYHNSNGYGGDYATILDDVKVKNPKIYKLLMTSIRGALKYLPITTLPLLNSNE